MRRTLRAALATALGATALAAPAHGAEVTASPDAISVSVNGFTDHHGTLRPNAAEHARLIREAGIAAGRTDAFWQWVEPEAPFLGLRNYDWRDFDALASLLAENEIRWLPVLAYSTFWSTSVPDTDHAPPVADADYLAYAEAFARRYGRTGTFWAERGGLPQRPVTAYEVWNEPNLAHFWLPKPDAGRYARLYASTREALRRADPQATAVMAGMFAYAFDYVQAMYAAEPALRGNVDVFAYHPYGPDAEHVLKLVRRMREVLDGLGESAVPMWITELGWATQGTGALPRLPDATRSGNLSLTTDAMLGSNCDVTLVNAYTWVTPETDPDHDDQWLGIYRADGTPTQAGHAYREAAARNASAAAGGARPALGLCRGGQRNAGPAARPLKLGIGLRGAGRRCFEAAVSYRGRPLNGIDVTFTAGGRAARVKTNVDGVARRCPGRAAVGRQLTASARLLDVAASRSTAVRVR